MRLSLIALAGIGLILLTSLGGATAPDEQAAPAAKGELRNLMVKRYEAAMGEMESRAALYAPGRVPLDDVCAAIQRFSNAGLQVATTPAYWLKLCEYAFERAKTIETIVKDKYENEVEPIQVMKLATYTRLDIEIKLHEARTVADAAAGKAGTKSGDSDLPPLNPPGKGNAET